ncbi:CDP-diacylglycerol--glycerol-3-phosphate 3-phosphatidyltransferase [Nocardiopsis ansamitocini]|uniref:CDP-diacylglycerol--glycerol-3-phosphate 3-phosphatidyltransferase n=1 Tax=Nocardiopsis ansamitocini TaxID=1670832 RepID=A0A9W6P3H5_9ACTN|nr:CDP-diacylglycerol--glycerol-3-phosphate 3-phosphatidyltransferase [Nocardiopsis ansamitocini]GLU46422.1 CDP-diacylglycerol--glycerol-3-phosphate 3-phosphatidyltransferase [Nocardiopsis ansamitocini]
MSRPDPAVPAGQQAPVLNIANVLTVSRLVMVPLFVIFMFQDGLWWRLAAFSVFVIAAITDRIDGELARRRNLVTDFGKIADPIADKALTGAALVVLSMLGELWWWVTIVILVREWGITALRFAVIRYGVIPASRGGKLKTVLQIVAISVYLFPLPDYLFLQAIAHAIMAVALGVTLWTGGDYIFQALKLRKQSRSASDKG